MPQHVVVIDLVHMPVFAKQTGQSGRVRQALQGAVHEAGVPWQHNNQRVQDREKTQRETERQSDRQGQRERERERETETERDRERQRQRETET